MTVTTKICGITTAEAAKAAADAGADMLGFVFFEKSPRNLTIEAAEALEPQLPQGPARVGVFVDAADEVIDGAVKALKLDYVQLHGSETIEYADEIRGCTGCKIIRAFSVAESADLIPARAWSGTADIFLFDAKAPEGSDLPGGNAVCFPWEIMQAWVAETPWMLAGGLTPDNVSDAVWAASAKGVDVSSGVESAPGVKDSNLIRAFLDAASVL